MGGRASRWCFSPTLLFTSALNRGQLNHLIIVIKWGCRRAGGGGGSGWKKFCSLSSAKSGQRGDSWMHFPRRLLSVSWWRWMTTWNESFHLMRKGKDSDVFILKKFIKIAVLWGTFAAQGMEKTEWKCNSTWVRWVMKKKALEKSSKAEGEEEKIASRGLRDTKSLEARGTSRWWVKKLFRWKPSNSALWYSFSSLEVRCNQLDFSKLLKFHHSPSPRTELHEDFTVEFIEFNKRNFNYRPCRARKVLITITYASPRPTWASPCNAEAITLRFPPRHLSPSHGGRQECISLQKHNFQSSKPINWAKILSS